MGSARYVGHGRHDPRGQHDGTRPRLEAIDDLLDGDEGSVGGEDRFLLHAEDAPEGHVAGPVGLLGVNDGHVRTQCGHRRQPFSGERTGHRLDRCRALLEPGARVSPQHGERESRRAGHIAIGQTGVAVLFDLEGRRPSVLDGVAEPVQAANARVAAPGEDQLAGAAHPDELVEDHVGGQSHQGQVPPALANDLLAGRVWDEVGEAFHGHAVAVMDKPANGVREAEQFSHLPR